MRFLVDESLSNRVAAFLAEASPFAPTTHSVGAVIGTHWPPTAQSLSGWPQQI
jgi:hypothetical protein